MKWNKPCIDYTRHISYSKRAERALKARLILKYGEAYGVQLWSNVKHIYEGYLTELPAIGGSKNPMADQLYDSLACFAYWEALPEKESVEEFSETVSATFFAVNSRMKPFPRWLSGCNQHLLNGVLGIVGLLIARMINRHVNAGEWNNAWKVVINPEKPKSGGRVILIGCPICDFAKQHGYLHLMPAMCNADYGSFSFLRLEMIRPKTVARGYDVCDYYLVNTGSKLLKKYPVRTDGNGFLYNDEPEGWEK